MPSKFLKDYLSRYGGVHDWHLQAFRVLNNRFSPRRTLYPGSWIHLTPSLVFPYVAYIDLSPKKITLDLLQYIEGHAEYQGKPKIVFHQSDYKASFVEEKSSFDLLISLSSGFVSEACSSYLKKGGLLFANNEHYDASMAYVDSKFKAIGVFKNPELLIRSKKEIESYFMTTRGIPITLEMVVENSKKAPSKARHKLKKKSPLYLFQKS